MTIFVVPARRVLCNLLAAVLLGAVLSVSSPQIALAAPGAYLVDDPVDAVDANVGDDICATASATCTLRASVQEANARGGQSDITFAPAADTSTLSLAGSGGGEIGDLEVASGVTVRLIGNSPAPSASTVIDASTLGDRHVHVLAGGRLELQMVALSGGSTSGDGGAILNEGQVLITNSPTHTGGFNALQSNSADGVGGAVANRTGAELTISNVSTSPSSSRMDVAFNSGNGGGGAIHNAGGSVTASGSTVNNTAQDVYLDNSSTPGDGGGISNTGGGSVSLGCRVFVRFAVASGDGGSVYNEDGQLTMVGSGLDGSSADDGGGLYNSVDGQVTIGADPTCNNSVSIQRSNATNSGGGLFSSGTVDIGPGAALNVFDGTKVDNATVGGAVAVVAGSLAVAGQLSISDTSASLSGGGLAVTGGAVTTGPGARIFVRDGVSGGTGGGVAVTGGSLAASGVVIRSSDAITQGGGMYVEGPGTANLTNSALIGNSASQSGGGLATVNASVAVINTTIAANGSSTIGGGVSADGGSTVLRHVSVVDNAPDGVSSTTSPTLERVLLARNSGQNCAGSTASGGDLNVFDEATCSPTGGDLTDPSRFAAVGSLDGDAFDGNTTSLAPGDDNPATDWVTDSGCGTPADDQNGGARPIDGDGDGVSHCDAGAVESVGSSRVWSISGTVVDELTNQPLQGVCVFSVDPASGDDGTTTATAADGTYTSDVVDGQYVMAFFMPLAGSGDKGCAEPDVDSTYQPEWYRNVAVEFDDDSDPDVIFPDPADLTLVVVAGANVAGIDACLGAGPGPGRDAPCGPAIPTVPTDRTTTAPPTADGTRTGAPPSSLAFTG